MAEKETPNQRRHREKREAHERFIREMGGTVGHTHAAMGMLYQRKKQHTHDK